MALATQVKRLYKSSSVAEKPPASFPSSSQGALVIRDDSSSEPSSSPSDDSNEESCSEEHSSSATSRRSLSDSSSSISSDALSPPSLEHRIDHHSSSDAKRNGEAREAAPLYRVGTKLKHFFDGKGWLICSITDTIASDHDENGEIRYAIQNIATTPQFETQLSESEVERAVMLSSIGIGSRLSLYREEDESYYNATVTALRDKEESGFCLSYESATLDEEWVNLSRGLFHLLPNKKMKLEDTHCCDVSIYKGNEVEPSTPADAPLGDTHDDHDLPSSPYNIDDISIGANVSLRRPETNVFETAVVVRMRGTSTPSEKTVVIDRYCVEFPDGTRLWTNLLPDDCRVLSLGEADVEEENLEEDHPVEVQVSQDVSQCQNLDVQESPKSAPCLVESCLVESSESDVKDDRGRPKVRTPLKSVPQVIHTNERLYDDKESIICNEGDHNERSSSTQRSSLEESPGPKDDADDADSDDGTTSSEDELLESDNPEDVIVGSRVGIWWSGDRKYYHGTVTDYSRTRKRNPFHILYDDDEEEWIDFHGHNFRFLPDSVKRPSGQRGREHSVKVQLLQTGTRVGVWWDLDKHYYHATVHSIKNRGAFHLIYDDGEEETLDLRSHDFFILLSEDAAQNEDSSKASSSSDGDESIHSDHDDELDDDDTVHDSSQQVVPKPTQIDVGTRVAIWWAGDRKFYNGTVTATRNSKKNHYIKYDDGDRHWLNLAKEDFRILNTPGNATSSPSPRNSYSAITEEDTTASEERNKPKARTKKRAMSDDHESDGDAEIQAKRRRLSWHGKRVAVEQIDPNSGKVLKVWSSMRKAEEMTGVRKEQIKRVLLHCGKPTAGSFFWRVAGTNNSPWTPPIHRSKKAVEQLCLKSGDILGEFESITAAKKAVGNACIGDTCDGKARSAAGYFWRWKGCNSIPESLRGMKKTIQARKAMHGSRAREFNNAAEAADWAEVEESIIAQWCREETRGKGFYWQYIFKERSAEEQWVGKCVSVQLKSFKGAWIDGVIVSYDDATGSHNLSLPDGRVESVDLRSCKHKFRRDDGEEPIEQICITTGEVLRVFPTARAASKATKTHLRRILPVLRSASHSAGGFFWRYKGSTVKPRPMNRRKSVEQLDAKTGKVINVFESPVVAGKSLDVKASDIRRCCRDYRGSRACGGFLWRYSDSEQV